MKTDVHAEPGHDDNKLVQQVEGVPLSRLVAYFLRLGTVGFGGPIALVSYMQRDLVEDRHWVSNEDYLEGLAFSQLSPGPLAAQLANYLGWVHSGTLGATMAGTAFVLPSLLMVLALAAMYVHFGQLAWIQGMFYGIGAAVSAIIVRSAWRLIQKTLGKDYSVDCVRDFGDYDRVDGIRNALAVRSLWIGCDADQSSSAGSRDSFPIASFGSGGLHGFLWPCRNQDCDDCLSFFLKAGAFVFGSGLAIVPFLYGGVVGGFHWLTERQFLDAVAVAMITPGPVVITSGFIGYLVAGPLGALAATLAVFLPPYLLVVFVAPYYRRFAKNRQVKAFVQGVTAAAVGAIAGAAIILSKRAIMDLQTVLIAAVSLVLLLRFKKMPEPLIILAAGIVGMTVKHGWL
jgi:chromate transporter